MNHAGEITPLTSMVRPHVAIITTVEPVHLEHFASVEAIAEAKAEIFDGLEPGGAAISTATIAHFELLASARARGTARASSRSAGTRRPTSRLEICSSRRRRHRHRRPRRRAATSPIASARRARTSRRTRSPSSRRSTPSAPTSTRRLPALAGISAADGPRRAHRARSARTAQILLIDESYNANPASMRAALARLGDRSARPISAPHRRAGRHAGARGRGVRRCTRASRKPLTPPGSIWSLPVGRI